MFKLLAIVAFCAPMAVMAAPTQTIDTPIVTPIRLAMGPDPGGHTGAGVTPETTKTGQSGDHNQGAGASPPSGSAGTSKPSKPDTSSAKRK